LTRFAKLAVAAAVATFVLIGVGGLVRATDSGLGCPDWPLCFGDWVPPADLHAWIEHSHRLVAAVLVGPLVAAVGLIAVFSDRRRDLPLLAAAVVAGVLVIVQSLLGAAVVLQGLAAELVTAHLGMALTVFAATIFIAERATHGPMPGAHARPGLTRLTGLLALALFAPARFSALANRLHPPRPKPSVEALPSPVETYTGSSNRAMLCTTSGVSVMTVTRPAIPRRRRRSLNASTPPRG